MRYYPFRLTPYLTKVRDSDSDQGQPCCLLIAERIHSGYEGEGLEGGLGRGGSKLGRRGRRGAAPAAWASWQGWREEVPSPGIWRARLSLAFPGNPVLLVGSQPLPD